MRSRATSTSASTSTAQPHGERAEAEPEPDEAAGLDGGVDVSTLARGAAPSAKPSREAPSPLSAGQSTEAGPSAGPSAVPSAGPSAGPSAVRRGGEASLGDSGLHGSVAFFGARHVGALQKRGAASLSPWKQRWFALHDGSLLYFDRPPELSRPRLAAYVQFSTLRVDEDSLGMSWALGDGSVVQTRACTLKALRYWAHTCMQLGVAVMAIAPLGLSPSRGVAERPSAAEPLGGGGGVIRYQKWSISVPAYQARARAILTMAVPAMALLTTDIAPDHRGSDLVLSPRYILTISSPSLHYLHQIIEEATSRGSRFASFTVHAMRLGEKVHAMQMHMPRACHARAMHMPCPCTCQGVDDAPLLRVRHPA